MFSGIIDDFKARLDLTLKALVAGAIVGFAGVAAFICGVVVLFLWVMQTYGTLQAWGTVAVLFGVIAVAGLIPLLGAGRKRRELARLAEARAAKAEAERKKNEPEWWQNPALLLTSVQVARMLTSVQVARTLGIKGLLPVVALGAVAAGYFLTRQKAGGPESDVRPAE